MTPWPSQIEGAKKGYALLKKYAIVYFAWEERTGKSLSALLIAEEAIVIKVLIVTKKGKPYDGWQKLLDTYKPLNKLYTLTTYHQLHKLTDRDQDLIILDEAHNYISAFPKPSKIWGIVRRVTINKPIIYLSATPHAQTPAQLYHQFALSDWSPWYLYTNYKQWHSTYGIEYSKYFNGRNIPMWDRVKDTLVLNKVKHLFISQTRQEIGFEHEPEDKLHYIELRPETKKVYNRILKKRVFEWNGYTIEYDTKTKLRFGLHMFEGGTLKYTWLAFNSKGTPVKQAKYFDMPNTEKIDYIKKYWGDKSTVAIMYNYIGEGIKLNKHFEYAEILQATTNAEGVDLMHIEHLIIYSQDFSTARHTQRRARQANKARTTPIVVHFLLVKKGISEEVYNTVSINKENYVDSRFEHETLK